jgi:hypothetical protein
MNETKTKKILLTGDYIVDHHLLKGNKSEASGQECIGTMIKSNHGGAKLTFDLMKKFVEKLNKNITINTKGTQSELIWPFVDMPELGSTQGTIRDSYLRWVITENKKKESKEHLIENKSPCDVASEIDDNDHRELLCRLDEKLGFGGKTDTSDEIWLKPDPGLNNEDYDTIIIDEAGIGYRNCEEAWPDFSKAKKIILKTTYPLCESILWEKLLEHKDKLITIVKLNQIKHYNIKVSNDISWEQTALDIVYGLHKDLTLRSLLKSRELIVTIGTAGAIVIKTDEEQRMNEYTLVFDPEYLENEWEEKFSNEIRNSIGLGSSFLAGFASSLLIKGLNTVNSVKVGLNSMTAAMLKGVMKLNTNLSSEPCDLSVAIDERFNNRYYSSAFVPSPVWSTGFRYLHNQDWSILENNYDNKKIGYKQKDNLFPLAFSLAENGIGNLHYAPRLTLGKITVFDRNEIENLRNIKKQIEFYDWYGDGKKPLNIAVFGPPGAGKSFIVKALAKSMFDGKKTKTSFLTFNLSEFRNETELPGAFHAIRDEVLRGNVPIVFWDEFDSGDYQWLKYMIAPMQDGEFREGKEVHPIGKSIFVFAGGMTYTMQQFTNRMDEEIYIAKKGPDFQSRISCSLNVFGPNRKPYFNSTENTWKREGDVKDICFSIRRSLFLRSILGSENKPLTIEPELLRVLIEVKSYKNGSRGLERLVRSLAVSGDRRIEPSDLPSKEIIQMNVDYDDFMEKFSSESISDWIALEKIAVSIHNSWLEKDVKHSVYYETYEDLSYDGRMDNISAASRMKTIIGKTKKFDLIPEPEAKSKLLKDAKNDFINYLEDKKNLDTLAEAEHEGWIKTREKANWKLGKRSNYHKLHPSMIPFNELDKGEQGKDRDSIKNYPSVLDGSGFIIVHK